MLYHTAPLNDAAVPRSQLQHYFRDQVRCMYRAENELFAVLDQVLPVITSEELKKSLSDYLLQLQAQIMRLEEIFGVVLLEPKAGACETVNGLVREIKRMLAGAQSGVVKDAAIVLTIRKAVYYKIAAYSAMEMLADSQGMEEACNLLHLSLEEERDSDMVLTDIAEKRIKNL